VTFNRSRGPYGGNHARVARLAVFATAVMSLAAVVMKVLPA